MQGTGTLLTLVQFLMTYMLNSSLGFFFGLINSQQGLAYLPILSVNFPAQVSFYMDFLISISTFDPLPVDVFYEIFGVWDFQWTNNPSSRPSLERIGIEDRIFVNVLGSMFLFMFAFFMS